MPQPRNAPIHHMTVLSPKASRKFYVLMEISRQLQITLILLFGFGNTVAATLPISVATPTQLFTIPYAVSPAFEIISAGSAALYIDAIRLIADKNRISQRIP